MRTIVTRPAVQASAWVAALQSRGVEAQALPLIGIEPAADAAPVRSTWQSLERYALVVFVSPNAVESFFAAAPLGATWPQGTRAGSPGPGTTSELRAHGVSAACIVEPRADAAQFDSESLWEQLCGLDWKGRHVLIVRGDGGREWLANALRDAGAHVELLAAYRRVAPVLDAPQRALLDEALASPAHHVWLFSSSEAIDHLEALRAGVWSASRCITTHRRIAQRAGLLGFGHVHEARPGLDSVVACIQSIGP